MIIYLDDGSRAHTVPTLRTVTSRDGCLVGEIHAISEGAEVVVEEPGVDVEGHRCRRVTEYPLDGLDVRAAGHQQARGGVQASAPTTSC